MGIRRTADISQMNRGAADSFSRSSPQPRRSARFVLALAYVAGALAVSAWCVTQTALDPAATHKSIEKMFATPEMQQFVAKDVTKNVNAQLGLKPTDKRVSAAVAKVVKDPAVTTAFVDAVSQAYSAVLADAPANPIVESTTLTNKLATALKRKYPDLAARVQQQASPFYELDEVKLPRLGGVRKTVNDVRTIGALVALALVGLSLALEHDRRAVARVGRRVAYLAITPVLLYIVAPRLLGLVPGNIPQISSAATRAFSSRIVPIAVLLVVVGLVIVIGAVTIPRMRDRMMATPAEASPPRVEYRVPTTGKYTGF